MLPHLDWEAPESSLVPIRVDREVTASRARPFEPTSHGDVERAPGSSTPHERAYLADVVSHAQSTEGEGQDERMDKAKRNKPRLNKV